VGLEEGSKARFIVEIGIAGCLLIDAGRLFIAGFISLFVLVARFTSRRFITACSVECRLGLA
jgi:hypothetical protein